MAALYLHNALHISNYEPTSSVSPHTRNVSLISNATLQSSSESSHPTEPLLRSETSESVAYLDLLSRQPTHPSGPRPEWTTSLSLDGDPVSTRERKVFREHFVRKRLRRLKLYKGTLEIVIGAFAVFNTVRYFVAFTRYDSTGGQAASLALGTSTGVSFAFTACAFILSLFQPYLLLHHVPLRPLLRIRTAFHALASFALFAPAVVNVALLFAWKNSSILELNVQRRCHTDIDVVWSVSDAKCTPPAWGIWVALSFLRLVVTVFIIISYHWIASAYHRVRRPSFSRSRRHRHAHGIPSEPYASFLSPSMAGISASSFTVPQHTPLDSQHQSSNSTLRSHPHSKHSSNQQPPTAVASSAYSDEDSDSNHSLETHGHHGSSSNGDAELNGFNDHFRSLVSQITRETEEGLELATSASPPQTPNSPPEDYSLANIPPAVGYDEFGRPYPPDERVSILNGYVRRMPTIESMGSREIGSMTTSSVHTDRDTVTSSIRSGPISRPPTRTNTLTASEYSAGSRPESRTNSITAGAEILLGANGKTSEVGELVDRGTADGKTDSLTSTGTSLPSTMSYYTAKSFGSSDTRAGDRGPSPPLPS